MKDVDAIFTPLVASALEIVTFQNELKIVIDFSPLYTTSFEIPLQLISFITDLTHLSKAITVDKPFD